MRECILAEFDFFNLDFRIPVPFSNQIRVVAFNVPQLTQASFLQKNQTLQFFYICNAEMAQSLSSLQKSEFLKLIILIFQVKDLKISAN